MSDNVNNFAESLFVPDPGGYLRFYPWGSRRGYRLRDLDDKRALMRRTHTICLALAGGAVAAGLGFMLQGLPGMPILALPATLLVLIVSFRSLNPLLKPLAPAEPYPVELRRAARVQAVRDALTRVLWSIFGLLILLIAIAIGGVGIWVFLLLSLLTGFILLIGAGPTAKKSVIFGLLLIGAALLLAETHWPQIATLEVLTGLVLAGLGILSLLTTPRLPRVPRVTFAPYPDNPPNPFLTTSLLQITCTPDDYRTLLATYKYKSEFPADVFYRLPVYTLARCPFCGVAYTEALDTHSLAYWYIDGNESRAVFAGGRGCPHRFAVQTHLNLNGAVPIEREYLHCTMAEQPYVMTEWLSDSIPAVAVMHSLPICRLEEDRFVPRYLLYTLVYYAQDARTLWARIRQREDAETGPEDYGHVLRYMSPGPRARDWAHWIEQGKLAWLDPTDPALPLRTGSPEEFPYGRIAGLKWWFEFNRGQPLWNGLAKPDQLFWQGPEGALYWP